jgi:hypothetical protein
MSTVPATTAGSCQYVGSCSSPIAAYDLPVAAEGPPWHRYLALLLDGLRAADRPPLPVPAPTYSSLDDVIATSKNRLR